MTTADGKIRHLQIKGTGDITVVIDASLGAGLGIVRLLGTLGIFELIKPELKKFSSIDLQHVKKSFYAHTHSAAILFGSMNQK